jgi:hypothetical protein
MNLIDARVVACPKCSARIQEGCYDGSSGHLRFCCMERYQAAEFFTQCSLELALDKAASTFHLKSEDFYSLVATVMEWLKDINVQYSQEAIHPDPKATPIYKRDERD